MGILEVFEKLEEEDLIYWGGHLAEEVEVEQGIQKKSLSYNEWR